MASLVSSSSSVVYPLNAKVKFAFEAGDDNQINLVAGTLVKVHNQTNDDWWDVEYNNTRGYAPASYLDVLPPPQPKKPPVPAPKAPAKIAAPAAGRATAVVNRKVETRDVLGLNGNDDSSTSSVRARLGALKQPLLDANDNHDTTSGINNHGHGNDDSKGSFTENKQPLLDATVLISDASGIKSSGRGENKPDIRLPPGNFASLAENMGMYTSYSLLALGPTAILMSAVAPDHIGTKEAIIGVYAALLGAIMWIYESRIKLTAKDLSCFRTRFPAHAIIYFLLGLPLFIAKGTILGACFIIVQTAVNMISAILGETATIRTIQLVDPTRNHDDDDNDDDDNGNARWRWCTRVKSWFFEKQAENKLRISVFIILYATSNVIIFFVVLRDWIAINNALLARNRLSSWAPYAKAFGNLLDYNCVLVLMPVCRTFLRLLYNRATRDKRLSSRILHYILSFTPLDHNIGAHKFLAKMIVFATVGHTVAHLINYALRPDQSVARFGYWSILSGGIICIIMYIMYAAAAENVKRGNFELFWYVHHLFVIFFILLLLHGAGGWNPNVWKWLMLPGIVYILERIARVYRSRQAVGVMSVTHMRSANGSNVLCLELSSSLFQYAEGQYIFLSCPHISEQQWHPFTISSAPQEDYLTLHIRVMGPGSWTRRLQDYLESMGPAGATHYTLSHMDDNGVNQPGKFVGPDGKPIFRADGPHSAPTQHVSRYSTVLVAGAGIGVTPLAATLKSIVCHRWKYFIGKSYPDNAHFVWSLSWAEIDTFRWLIRVIKDVQDELVDARAKHGDSMNNKVFDFHIYISSVPRDAHTQPLIIGDTPEFWGLKQEPTHTLERKTATWTRDDLYKLVKKPNSGPTKLGDITVWSGRPNWDDRFAAIAARHPSADIGVLFCGNAFIGQNLSDACKKYSQPRSGGPMFRLHKENF